MVNCIEWAKTVVTLALGSQLTQGLARVRDKRGAQEEHLILLGSAGECERMNPHTNK